MATNASYIYIYSNDGSERLSSYSTSVTTHTVTESGIAENGSEKWAYAGTNTFFGFATSPNATEPTYAIGSSITVEINGGSTTLYIVEAASKQEETSGVTVEYNGSVVATIPSGNKATFPIADKKMKTDIVITVPETENGTNSAIPTEVSTEAEMNALLSSGIVGGVYKYTGTTGTYENGALYVLEAELGTFTYTQSGAWYSTPIVRQFPLGMTWAEFISSEYNAIAQDGQGDYAVVGQFIMRDDGQVMFSGNNVNGTDAHTLAVYYNSSYTLVYGADVILDKGIYDSTHTSSGGGGN